MCKAAADQGKYREDGDRFRKEFLLPVLPVSPYDGLYVVLIHIREVLTDRAGIGTVLVKAYR